MAEQPCGIIHITIAEAILHAEENLGMRGKSAEEYWGTLSNNSGLVVGFKASGTKRWRLDYDPNPQHAKWVHVNEENFDAPKDRQKTVHFVDNKNYTQVHLYYQKWTKKHR
ncbi:MAG: hypothetical protein ABSH09_00650 [Bryobacteraceae bacterium]|jgi:hypothetical protein